LQQAVPPLVQLGDYIQLYGGTSYKILGVQSVTYDATNTPTSLLLLANLEFSAQNLPPNPTSNYLITRQPRPIAGEALLQLPDDVVIDPGLPLPNPPVTLGNPIGSRPQVAGPPFNYDILFTPTGALTGPLGDSNGKIVLWVRDFAQDSDQPGAMPLVVIFSRTGRIGGFPSNPDPVLGDPYIYVLDPRNTGL
jgi:hypothetical protein